MLFIKDRIIKDLTPQQPQHLVTELIKSTMNSKPAVTKNNSEVLLSQSRGKRIRIDVNRPPQYYGICPTRPVRLRV